MTADVRAVSGAGATLADVARKGTEKGTESTPAWARRLQREREAQGWTVPGAIDHLRHAAYPVELPDDDAMKREWTRWESGQVVLPSEMYRTAIAKTFQSIAAAFFDLPGRPETFVRLTEEQTAELIQRLRHSSLSQGDMDALGATVEQLCTDYASEPAPVVLGKAQTWLEKVNGLFDKRITLSQHRDILTMAGWLTLLVACLHYDTGNDHSAEVLKRDAVNLADEVGDADIAGWAAEIRAWMALTTSSNHAAIAATQDGLARTSTRPVAVQLHAQAARAWARVGNREEAFTHMNAGRNLLEHLPYPENPRNHFQVDPAKWDFYAMDIWRLVGEYTKAGEAATAVILTSTAPDGRSISPMRLAEAKLTRAAVIGHGGDVDGALELAGSALDIDRRSLPALLLTAREVATQLATVRPKDEAVRDLVAHIDKLAAQEKSDRTNH